MKFLHAAIKLGFPADCATNGYTYDDLKRTWNSKYGDVPLRAALAPLTIQKMSKRPKRKKFLGLF